MGEKVVEVEEVEEDEDEEDEERKVQNESVVFVVDLLLLMVEQYRKSCNVASLTAIKKY